MRILSGTVALACMLALVPPPVEGHHSFSAEYDGNKPITLKGTVKKMEWINPHAWIHLDVKNPDGTVTSWMIEARHPTHLSGAGGTGTRCSPARRSPSRVTSPRTGPRWRMGER